MAIHEHVTDRCPECRAFLDRDFNSTVDRYGMTVDFTTCRGNPSHTWKILKLYRDRSVYHYRLIGPIERAAQLG